MKMKAKVAVIGINGMLGNTVFRVLQDSNLNVTGISRKELDAETAAFADIEKVVACYDYIVNCIGIIKPYIHDTHSGEVERAIAVNALFPHKLARCGIKVIQIATDCVYDGVKGNYIETDKHNATDVYGKTKSLGEVISDAFLNLRCSIIGLEKNHKKSLLEWFLNQPDNVEVNGFKNHYWNGISTIAFAKICKGIIENNSWFHGVQHVIPDSVLLKSDMLKVFARVFNRADININDTDAEIAIDRTLSTLNEVQNRTLWEIAGYKKIPTIENLIEEIKTYG
ncbi:NAD(P)-dependent oxidoreductase [Spirochaetia bacterium]|nr:NAD(P)-dependent oxidoreductase [Spirochaetia bacterium]